MHRQRRVLLIGSLASLASRALADPALTRPTLAILFFDYTGQDMEL